MSSAQYKLIGSPPLEPLPPGARLKSATGTSMEAWGLTSCLVCIGRKMYAQSFIVCNKMMTNVIVGRDFLSTYKLSITWGAEGTMEVLEGQEPVIQMGEVHQYPAYVGGWQKYLRAQWLLFPPLRISHLSEERHFSVLIH